MNQGCKSVAEANLVLIFAVISFISNTLILVGRAAPFTGCFILNLSFSAELELDERLLID